MRELQLHWQGEIYNLDLDYISTTICNRDSPEWRCHQIKLKDRYALLGFTDSMIRIRSGEWPVYINYEQAVPEEGWKWPMIIDLDAVTEVAWDSVFKETPRTRVLNWITKATFVFMALGFLFFLADTVLDLFTGTTNGL